MRWIKEKIENKDLKIYYKHKLISIIGDFLIAKTSKKNLAIQKGYLANLIYALIYMTLQ